MDGTVMSGTASDTARARALLGLHEALGEAEPDLAVLLQRAAHSAATLLGDAGAVWVLDGQRVTLRAFSRPGASEPDRLDGPVGELTRGDLTPEPGLLSQVVGRGQPVVATARDLAAVLPRVEPPYQRYLRTYGAAGLAVVPLLIRGRHLGAIGVARDAGGAPFDQQDLELLRQVGKVVALTLSNGIMLEERGEAQRRASAMVHEDELTGLLNRRGFLHALCEHEPDPVAPSALVVVLDVDGFTLVNNGFGHAAGDAVLSSLASRLCLAVPPTTPVARLGADVFAMLVEGADHEEAAHIVRDAIEECTGTVSVMSLAVPMSLCVGTAPLEPGRPDVALQNADLAMRRAKSTRVAVAAYDPRLDDPATHTLREVLALRRAIAEGDLVVHYQPVVPVEDGPLRVEALVRRRVDQQLLPPAGWLQTADRAGLMPAVTTAVVEQVVAQLAAWWAAGLEVECAVNVPAPVLALPALADDLVRRLDAAGLPRRALSVEVTESDLVGAEAKAALSRCAAAGIAVAVDDFGTGWSALSYLVDLPLTTLKIDRAFVDKVDVDRRKAAVVRAVVDVAHQLGLSVVAEGVETAAVAEAVIDLGADHLQGFHFARPAGAEDTERVLRAGLVATRS
ncbi:MAG: bifunctional diguanylate cyclase/phosphodiesterase [Mycobacteriales bacterium]